MRALVAVPVMFLIVGVVFVTWPDKVRKYDQRMTRLIKSRDEYVAVVKLYGVFFLIMGGAFLILFIAGAMK